jgi:hypothetical protein
MRISVLGYTGFIAESVLLKLRNVCIENIEFDSEVVINLIVKAHDLNKVYLI